MINTGTELLLGDVLNTHLGFIAREIFPLGLRIERQITVPDGSGIGEALAKSLDADLVFVTGGLGPTSDDVTRENFLDSSWKKMKTSQMRFGIDFRVAAGN